MDPLRTSRDLAMTSNQHVHRVIDSRENAHFFGVPPFLVEFFSGDEDLF